MSWRATAAVTLLALLALLLRCLGLPEVFPGGGLVELDPGDSAYHARRALYGFVNFPAVLQFDSYIAFPDGAEVPMPPLFDWALAAVARALGTSEAVFERVAAWWSPLLGALTVLPVFAAARAVGGAATGWLAALLFACLPASIGSSGLGNVDHNAAVALLGTTHLALCLELLRRGSAARAAALALVMAFTRAALLLSWSGSLLYVAVGEAALLLGAAVADRRSACWGQAAGALGGALLVVPWLWVSGAAANAPFATTNLSWFHVVALGAAATAAAGFALLSARVSGVPSRLVLATGICLGVAGALLLAVPPLGDGLLPAAAFLTRSDSWGHRNVEQMPLFSGWAGGSGPLRAHVEFGLLAWALPLLPFVALWQARERERRGPATCLALWTAGFGGMALAQLRFSSDLAPAAAVTLALLLCGATRRLARQVPRLPAAPAAALLGLVLLAPGLAASHWREVPAFVAHLRGLPPDTRLGGARSLNAFAREIRAVTPETAGYFDSSQRPEYAVLCKPSFGHTLSFAARRPTAANGLGPYLDRPKYEAVLDFYRARSAAEALAIAEALGTRYLMSFAREAAEPAFFHDRLHRWDGVPPTAGKAAQRLRLVTEGPADGLPLRVAYPSGRVARGTIPYKLFELVPGALVEAAAGPGTSLVLEVDIETRGGRRFRYRAQSRADANGLARLRVPYATETALPTRPTGPYRVQLGAREGRLRLSDADVLSGRVVPLALPPPGAP